MGNYKRIRPTKNRWGMKYGSGGGSGWHWYDILIGVILFIIFLFVRKYLIAAG